MTVIRPMSVNNPITWIAAVPRDRAEQLVVLRDHMGVEALEQNDCFWLRGGDVDSIIEPLRSLLGCERFVDDGQGRLIPSGQIVPVDFVPDGEWQPLLALFHLVPPRRDLPAREPSRFEFTLVRAESEQAANCLVTPFDVWASYVETAPAIRLAPLSFAASSQGRVVIRGTPCPPIPGTACREVEKVILPLGWQVSPNISSKSIKELLGQSADDVVFFEIPKHSEPPVWHRIQEDDFVAASRSAVRFTAREHARKESFGGLA